MKIRIAAAAITLLVLFPVMTVAGSDHAKHHGNAAHEEVVDGVKATFRMTGIAEELKSRGLAMPLGARETHHLAAEFRDAKSGRVLSKGLVAIRLQGPGQHGEPRELAGMEDHFGIDLALAQPGKYGIMCRFVLEDGRKRQAMFWYEVK